MLYLSPSGYRLDPIVWNNKNQCLDLLGASTHIAINWPPWPCPSNFTWASIQRAQQVLPIAIQSSTCLSLENARCLCVPSTIEGNAAIQRPFNETILGNHSSSLSSIPNPAFILGRLLFATGSSSSSSRSLASPFWCAVLTSIFFSGERASSGFSS